MSLSWGLYNNLEYSLKEFLDTKISFDEIKDNNGVLIPIRVGKREDNDWTLPCITVYFESENAPRLEIGSNKRQDIQSIIIDIFATNDTERKSLAKWVTDTINNGFTYYSYSPNPSNPDSPTKVEGGLVTLNFLTNAPVALGQNISEIDAHRHRILINVWVSGT